MMNKLDDMTDSIPTSKLARSRVVAGAMLNVGGKHLKHLSKRPFMSASALNTEKVQLEDETARLAFEALSKLRGTALKISQMLSMETSLVPESFRRELSKSYHQVPPLGRVLVRKLVREEFGISAEQLFAEFDQTAFAAASLGQVHSARDENTNLLAVKLQYPGISVTINNDLQMARMIVKQTKQAAMYLSSLEEIESRLKEELDYRIEADNTQWFRENLKLDDVIIPKVYRKLSSKRVLTTQHLNGKHLDQWLASEPSQSQRNRAAQLIMNCFAKSFFELKTLHTDPNPGNYLFNDNRQLGLIDFGCVRRFSNKFVSLVPKLIKAFSTRDKVAILNIYLQLGMKPNLPTSELDAFCNETLLPFGDWVSAPFKQSSFDFGKLENAYSAEGTQHLHAMSKVKGFDNIAKEFVFYTRTYTGLYQLFERLGATVKMQHQWLI